MDQKMIGIYHSRDLDGFTSGAILKLRFPNITLIGFDYGENLSEKLKGYEPQPVIMIDVSLPIDEMIDLHVWSKEQLTWIDHHKSAIDAFNQKFPGGAKGMKTYLQDGIAACEIAWGEFFPNSPLPTAVKLLGEYDTWRNSDTAKWSFEILPFQYGMRMIVSKPEDFPSALFFVDGEDPFLNQIVKNGSIILDYQKMQNERLCRSSSFEVNFEGFRAICVNTGAGNSQIFESVYDEAKHDIMIPFVFTGDKWVFSIYTTKQDIDCSEIAKMYGGGGHRKAAGFQTTDAHFFAETFLIFKNK